MAGNEAARPLVLGRRRAAPDEDGAHQKKEGVEEKIVASDFVFDASAGACYTRRHHETSSLCAAARL